MYVLNFYLCKTNLGSSLGWFRLFVPAGTVAHTFPSQLIAPKDRRLAADCPDQELPALAFGQGAFHAPLLLKAPHPFSWGSCAPCQLWDPIKYHVTCSTWLADPGWDVLSVSGISLIASAADSACTRTSRRTHGQVLTIIWQLVNAGQVLQLTPQSNSP